MYRIDLTSNTTAWDAFVKKCDFSPFVQSSTYGEFYKKLGEEYWILSVFNDTDEIVGGCLIVSTHAKRGNFMYIPYGPVLPDSPELITEFSHALKKLGSKHGYDFIRVSPFADNTEVTRTILVQEGYRPAPMHVLAEDSWILDLQQSADHIFAGMKKNHRNLIHRCEREGIHVEQRTDAEALNALHTMLDVTEKRHNFTRFSKEYINAEFELFSKNGEAELFVATLADGRIDSVAMVIFFGSMAVYRHSGSLNLDKHAPSSYLVQWHVIQEAKKRGMHWYNFWGVEPPGQPNHPFAGIGHFKRGFGGFEKNLVHCHDYALTWRYYINWVVETIRRKKRGF